MSLIDPITVEITTQRGNVKTFKIGKVPAITGREIVAKYPVSLLPRVGDYQVSEETMLKLMAHVAVVLPDGSELPLSTRVLIDNHVEDWETLAKLEVTALEHNCSFFGKGRTSDFLEGIAQKAQALIFQMLTASSEQSSKAGKRPSAN